MRSSMVLMRDAGGGDVSVWWWRGGVGSVEGRFEEAALRRGWDGVRGGVVGRFVADGVEGVRDGERGGVLGWVGGFGRCEWRVGRWIASGGGFSWFDFDLGRVFVLDFCFHAVGGLGLGLG